MLSTLYQEKILTEQEIEELKQADRLVVIQCTKPPDVVKRTAELLAEVGRDEKGKQLNGQWLCSVCCCVSVVVYLLFYAICNEQMELIRFYSLAITLSRVYRTDHKAVVVPKPLQVCIHCKAG